LKETIDSLNYWIREINKELPYNAEIIVLIEKDSVINNKSFFEKLGAKLFIVPKDYIPPNNTNYKARALQYFIDQKKMNIINSNTWIYHQDEETIIVKILYTVLQIL